VAYLTGASQIEEIDISQFDLKESDDPDRRQILDRLQRLGSDYGIEIIDHIPVGNLTRGDYLRTLALPLVSSITRLRQATETLREITEEEIDEEIQAKGAELKLAVRETDQVLREIKSMQQTLNDTENKEAIMRAREATIENAAQEEIAPALSLIESLQAQIRAKEMSTIFESACDHDVSNGLFDLCSHVPYRLLVRNMPVVVCGKQDVEPPDVTLLANEELRDRAFVVHDEPCRDVGRLVTDLLGNADAVVVRGLSVG